MKKLLCLASLLICTGLSALSGKLGEVFPALYKDRLERFGAFTNLRLLSLATGKYKSMKLIEGNPVLLLKTGNAAVMGRLVSMEERPNFPESPYLFVDIGGAEPVKTSLDEVYVPTVKCWYPADLEIKE